MCCFACTESTPMDCVVTGRMTGNVQPEAPGGSPDEMHGGSPEDQAGQATPAPTAGIDDMCARMHNLDARGSDEV